MENISNNNSGFLIKTAELFLIIGFILCLGNIISFIGMNIVLGDIPSVTSVYWQRLFVSRLTHMFIIPGLWMLIISEIILGWRVLGFFKHKWISILQILIILIFINGMFIILPMSDRVTAIAAQQMHQQTISSEYTYLKNQEDIFGMINFIMMICSLILIIYKQAYAINKVK